MGFKFKVFFYFNPEFGHKQSISPNSFFFWKIFYFIMRNYTSSNRNDSNGALIFIASIAHFRKLTQ